MPKRKVTPKEMQAAREQAQRNADTFREPYLVSSHGRSYPDRPDTRAMLDRLGLTYEQVIRSDFRYIAR